MDNLLRSYKIHIGEGRQTPFLNRAGIYQDGTVPFCRDARGKLWAMAGHSHMGHIGMFEGTSLDDMSERYPIELNFSVGHADYAFDRVRYPEGVRARGSIWPFGLYICPVTHRFFAFFHNETGWNGRGTAYDSLGPCETPRFDSDFRHIGLMHSDDEGKTWTFDRWVLTAEEVCFTQAYSPEVGRALGQREGVIGLGSGDFTLFDGGKFLYLVYNIVHVDMRSGKWVDCNAYLARSRKRTDGVMGDFVKFYNGSFCEAGNFGKESPIATNAWHARIARLEELGAFVMTSSPIDPALPQIVADYLEIRTSKDLLEWSAPIAPEREGKKFGSHYHAPLSYHGQGEPQKLGRQFTLLVGHNGTDVTAYDVTVG